MDSEDWKEFQEKGKLIRLNRLRRHGRQIKFFVDVHCMSLKQIKDSHFRITDGKTTLDIFPMSKRYHNLNTNKRGSYHYLDRFLKSVFYGSRKSN